MKWYEIYMKLSDNEINDDKTWKNLRLYLSDSSLDSSEVTLVDKDVAIIN